MIFVLLNMYIVKCDFTNQEIKKNTNGCQTSLVNASSLNLAVISRDDEHIKSYDGQFYGLIEI